MSIILQEKERVIFECVYNYLISKKIINNNDCVLCFDGIMIKANKYNIKLLDELSTVVFDELKFKLQFSYLQLIFSQLFHHCLSNERSKLRQ